MKKGRKREEGRKEVQNKAGRENFDWRVTAKKEHTHGRRTNPDWLVNVFSLKAWIDLVSSQDLDYSIAFKLNHIQGIHTYILLSWNLSMPFKLSVCYRLKNPPILVTSPLSSQLLADRPIGSLVCRITPRSPRRSSRLVTPYRLFQIIHPYRHPYIIGILALFVSDLCLDKTVSSVLGR